MTQFELVAAAMAADPPCPFQWQQSDICRIERQRVAVIQQAAESLAYGLSRLHRGITWRDITKQSQGQVLRGRRTRSSSPQQTALQQLALLDMASEASSTPFHPAL